MVRVRLSALLSGTGREPVPAGVTGLEFGRKNRVEQTPRLLVRKTKPSSDLILRERVDPVVDATDKESELTRLQRKRD